MDPRGLPTRVHCASMHALKLAHGPYSLTHYAKGTLSKGDRTLLELLVSMRFQDLFHSLSRGLFHLSLTVLVHYG